MGIARKENMRICYECPIMAKDQTYFPYQKGIVESAKTLDKPESEHCFMLTGKN